MFFLKTLLYELYYDCKFSNIIVKKNIIYGIETVQSNLVCRIRKPSDQLQLNRIFWNLSKMVFINSPQIWRNKLRKRPYAEKKCRPIWGPISSGRRNTRKWFQETQYSKVYYLMKDNIIIMMILWNILKTIIVHILNYYYYLLGQTKIVIEHLFFMFSITWKFKISLYICLPWTETASLTSEIYFTY